MNGKELLQLGKLCQSVDDLNKAVNRVEETLEKLNVKVDEKLTAHEIRITETEKKVSKQRGFFIAIFLMFPVLTGGILLLLDKT